MRARLMGKAVAALALLVAAGAMVLVEARPAESQQLVFRPTNPAFGGNPMNQQWLLSTAQAQKRFDQEDTRFVRDPILDFQQSLQRQILSALSREIIQNRFGSDLSLLNGGRFDLGDFVIEIFPGLAGVDISILNVLTGAQTTITIPNF
jgi:curli production assembly/transport component CsgF